MRALTATTFSAGPSDTLATLDVYKAQGGGVVNSILDKRDTDSTFDVSKLLANGGKGSIGTSGSLLNLTSTGGVKLNTKSIQDRLLKSAPGLASSLRNMSQTAQDKISSTFIQNPKIDFNVGSDSFKVDSAAFSDLSSYGDYVNDTNAFSASLGQIASAGGASAYDIDAHATMLSGGICQGSDFGIPKSHEFLTNNSVVQGNSSLLMKVAAGALPILAKNGDLGNMASIANGPGGQVFSAVLPNYASTIKQNYSYSKYGVNTGAQINDYTNLISIFTGADSQWNVIDRIGDATGTTGTETFNLVRLLGGSREFQELIAIGVMSLVDDHKDKYQGLAGMFGETTVDAEIRRDFPMVWQESYNVQQTTKQNKTLDPRVVNTIAKSVNILTQPRL